MEIISVVELLSGTTKSAARSQACNAFVLSYFNSTLVSSISMPMLIKGRLERTKTNHLKWGSV